MTPAEPPLAFSIPTSTEEEQRRLFRGFRACGFDGLQLKGGQYGRYLLEPERFRDEWGDDPAACAGLIFGGTLDNEGVATLRRVFDFAAGIGSGMVVFCHGTPRAGLTADDLRSFARRLSELGREAAQSGLKLSLHHHYNQPVMHHEDLAVFFEAATPGTLGLTVDTAHLVKSGVQDIAGVLREYREVVDNVHLKDFAGGEFRTLGQGEIPFAPVFAALREIGYTGWLCADEESGADVEESMRVSREFIRRGVQREA
jgi:inosose dehydratase